MSTAGAGESSGNLGSIVVDPTTLLYPSHPSVERLPNRASSKQILCSVAKAAVAAVPSAAYSHCYYCSSSQQHPSYTARFPPSRTRTQRKLHPHCSYYLRHLRHSSPQMSQPLLQLRMLNLFILDIQPDGNGDALPPHHKCCRREGGVRRKRSGNGRNASLSSIGSPLGAPIQPGISDRHRCGGYACVLGRGVQSGGREFVVGFAIASANDTETSSSCVVAVFGTCVGRMFVYPDR